MLETFFVAGLLLIQIIQSFFTVKAAFSDKAKGFYLTTESTWLILGLGWVIHGVNKDEVGIWASGALNALVCLTAWSQGSRKGAPGFKKSLLFAALSIAIFVTGFAVAGFAGVAFGVAFLSVVQFLPQFFKSFKDIRGGGNSSVSVGSSSGRLAYTGTWLIYSTMIGDWVTILWGITGVFAFGLQFMSSVLGSRSKESPPRTFSSSIKRD